MRLAFTGDLHVDVSQKNWDLVPILAEFVKIIDPDIFVLCGDISPDIEQVEYTLELFSGVSCEKIFVPGNHDIWVSDKELQEGGHDSFEKYFCLLPQVCYSQGFIPLWMEPVIHDGVGFVGTIGWYDYSFGSGLFQFTEDEYSLKTFRDNIWNDLRYARWVDASSMFEKYYDCIPDSEVSRQFNTKLSQDINGMTGKKDVREIVVVTHHPPFRELITFKGDPLWDYFSAFMGSSETGKLLLQEPKVTHAICGHLHERNDRFIGQIRALSASVGYLYQDRRKPIRIVEDSLGLIHVIDSSELFGSIGGISS